MKTLIKNKRIEKNLTQRELAQHLEIDSALIVKWENGSRKPTKKQLYKLSEILEIDLKKLIIEWMSEVILYEIGDDSMAYEALKVAESKMNYSKNNQQIILNKNTKEIIKEIDSFKKRLNEFRHLDSYRIAQALELEYTFESNRIEGNTLTLQETDLVINEGLTISGKSMREHLEAINHQDALVYLKELVEKSTEIKERDILNLHHLVLKGIHTEHAGKYRQVQVMIKGSKHTPPQPYLVPKQMEDLFIWYQINQNMMHPIILAAEMSERLVTIHPFIDGNGRTSRLLMNLILLKNGYIIANIKGDYTNRLNYYNVLEKAQTENQKESLYEFVALTELDAIKRYLTILGAE